MNQTPGKGKGLFLLYLLMGVMAHSFAQTVSTRILSPARPNTRTDIFQSSFKTIFGGIHDDFGNAMVVAGDCGLIVAGETNSFGNGANDGMVTKIDQAGTVLWSKAIGGELDEYFLKIQRLPGENYIATGLHGDPNNLFGQSGFAWLVKMDGTGNIIWDKYYSDGTINGNYARDICQTPDGGFVLCGTYGNLANAAGYKLMVAKFNAAGDPIWCRTFYAGANVEAGRKNIILTPDNNLLVAGFVESQQRVRKAILSKLDAATGAMIWTQSFSINNSSSWFEQIDLKENFIFLNTFVLAPNKSDLEDHLLKLDLTGKIISSIHVKMPNQAVAKILPLNANELLIATDDTTNPDHLVLARVNTNGGAYWTKKYDLSFFVSPSDITMLSDSNLVICGTNLPGFATNPTAAFREAFIIKTDSAGGQLSCPVDDGSTETEASAAFGESFVWDEVNDIKLKVNNPSDKSIVIQPEQDKVCGVSPACTISAIHGEDSICVNGRYRYSVTVPPGCQMALEWNFDPAVARLMSKTDSSIELQFNRSGHLQLLAGAGSSCSAANRTLDIQVFGPPDPDIAKDAFLCGSDPIILQAPAGFSAYLWQDGSASPTYTVTQPGLYWVEVKDEHHCVVRDSAKVEVKDCGRNIYFPNAFTPGNDQLNDQYRPKVFGQLTQYSLKIYNRAGVLVFETADVTKGWDGSYNGKQQSSATFIWFATYHFAGSGEGTKMQKGVVTLIR